MRLRLLGLVAIVLAAGCQAPAPATPTPTQRPASTQPPAPTVAATAPPVTSSRVETLNAASAAFQKGDLTTASGLYERVLNTPPTGEDASTTAALDDFAHFRAMVTLLADGHEDEAHAHEQALQQADPNAPLARLSAQLWDQYGMVGQLRGACTQLQPLVASQAGPTLNTLHNHGVAVDALTLCSVPQKSG